MVTVGPDGLVTAVAAGTARITGTSDRVSGSATVTVPAPVVVAAAPERALSQPPAVVASAPAAAAPQPAPAPADPRPEIAAVIERYAQAITARDVEAIRRLYPGLTPQQERAWRDFFGSVSELSAELSIASLETSGATARAVVDAVYDFRANRRQTQNTSFTMELRRGTTGWQIVTVQ
ncbi:MAG: hypothetical protein A2W29_03380 [Gemmatimonadetes bacterium RBG_16_66_8]|nr:MAG: hypothetical protein A2W29_03380 [Gemmatimonadetes bacterium RBG_16_66_8]